MEHTLTMSSNNIQANKKYNRARLYHVVYFGLVDLFQESLLGLKPT